MDWYAIIFLAVLLLVIGFFLGMEAVFLSIGKLSMEIKKRHGFYSSKVWGKFKEHPVRFVGSTLIVVNLLIVLFGIHWQNTFDSVWNFWGIENIYTRLVANIFLSWLVLITISFLFKSFFRAGCKRIIEYNFLAFLIQSMYSVFSGIALYLVHISEWILKYIFNVKLQTNKGVFNKVDLGHYIAQLKLSETGEAPELNDDILKNVLTLSEVKVRECLVPRKEIEAVEITITIEELVNKFVATKLSKLVVYEHNIDNILGYVHQLDLFKHPKTIRDILLPIPKIPTSMIATDLINKFSTERKSIGWVIDEFGGTAGIVTMEDLLEEIFGDINDEYDVKEELVDKQLTATEFIFSGRLEVDYLADKYQLQFPKNEEAETLSGYIINQHESIPRQRDRIIIDNYQFDILNVSATRIETVKMKILR